MGAQSTDQRTLGRAGGRARRLRRLASCPGEDCPVGAAYPGFRPPRPIACSDAAAIPASLWAVSLSVTGTSPIHQSTRNYGSHLPLFRPFHVQNRPRPPSWASAQIPVHGYDSTSRPSPPMAPKGRTRASSQVRHGVPPHGSPHSIAIRPTVTARCGLTRARRRER